MKFHRTLQPFKVISFDLDDTLYNNSEVIRLAEQNCVDFLRNLSQINELDLAYWQSWKTRIAGQDPILCENMTQWRKNTVQAILRFHGKSEVDIETILRATMTHFFEWRHKIQVPAQSIAILNQLKTQYSLAALTNGNVEPQRIGLSQFDLVLTGGQQGRAKPHQELFHRAADYFNVRPQEMLHIGDDLTTDVQGAIQAGCQAVWLNLANQKVDRSATAPLLPTVEITDLQDILELTAGKH